VGETAVAGMGLIKIMSDSQLQIEAYVAELE